MAYCTNYKEAKEDIEKAKAYIEYVSKLIPTPIRLAQIASLVNRYDFIVEGV